ncbi:hypothetical protein GUJ93_ZPchr0010g7553 [Zizania palustris]|uniref:Uncharacterized protein n=1 Tax=Zizania palustris TaxID=103762 RepID=A0A8J5WAN8_ZIZPA|nr:hypothetical protein GUJ93_ZPchr0010g7553 [Zizania palustris]
MAVYIVFPLHILSHRAIACREISSSRQSFGPPSLLNDDGLFIQLMRWFRHFSILVHLAPKIFLLGPSSDRKEKLNINNLTATEEIQLISSHI